MTARTIDRGCTEAEAMAAAAMVGRLLERYALTMDEVDVRREPCVQVQVPIGGKQRRPIDTCVPAIARFCDCKVWLARSTTQAYYVFFGFDTDTQLAAYLFHVIGHAMTCELKGFRESGLSVKGVALRRTSASFLHGLAARVAERLETMHTERERSVAAQRPAGNALTVVRHVVVEEAFRATKIRLHAQQTLSLRRDAAYRAGKVAGERVNLNRPVQHAEPALLR